MKAQEKDVGFEEARAQALQSSGRLGRRKLSPAIVILLWVLRVYVLVAIPLVIYAFFHALRQAP